MVCLKSFVGRERERERARARKGLCVHHYVTMWNAGFLAVQSRCKVMRSHSPPETSEAHPIRESERHAAARDVTVTV